jgi:hypothetical protein
LRHQNIGGHLTAATIRLAWHSEDRTALENGDFDFPGLDLAVAAEAGNDRNSGDYNKAVQTTALFLTRDRTSAQPFYGCPPPLTLTPIDVAIGRVATS